MSKKLYIYFVVMMLSACASGPREIDFEPIHGTPTIAECTHRCTVKGFHDPFINENKDCVCRDEDPDKRPPVQDCNQRCNIKGWAGGYIGEGNYCQCNDGSKGLSNQ
jgi:hypothetical protein